MQIKLINTIFCIVYLICKRDALQSDLKRDKLCAKYKDVQDCIQAGRGEKVNCTYNLHDVDCILDIEQDRSDFGRITPEEALLAAKFVNNLVVIGEFPSEAILDDSEFATVVLVRNDHTGGLKNLRNKKYCHPGFKFDQIATDLILKEFEYEVLKLNNAEGCSASVQSSTLFEKELKALTEFFGPSCRPGPWIGFEQFDSTFYNQYSKLCEFCPNDNKCSVPAGTAPFMNSLKCLINGGDVALTTINTVYEYFNISENVGKRDEYRYLCRNGDMNMLDNPCTWSKQPWNLLVTNRKKEGSIRSTLQDWFAHFTLGGDLNKHPTESEEFVSMVKQILFPSERGYDKIKFVEGTLSLRTYIQKYRTIPDTTDKCNQNIKWCTVSNAEQKKCEWLSQANANLALQPTIKCIQSHNMFACLDDIKKDQVDVVASDAHFGYIARRKNLAPLAYPDTAFTNRIQPIIVIKNSDTSITKIQDLKNKKACFPEYAGIEWLSFINTARHLGVLSKASCDYGQLISDFVSDSCMPGAHDQEHEVSDNIDKDKLCQLCQPHPTESKTGTNCNSNIENRFYGNLGALECLKDVGDFAVVTKAVYPELNSNEFKVMCKNGSIAIHTGFDVDISCLLTEIIDSEVLSKKNSPKNEDIRVMLLNLERRFGLDRHKSFEVFNIFNNTLDLLFKDSTKGLTNIDSSLNHIQNFVNLFADVDKCVETGDGSAATEVKAAMLPLVVLTMLTMLQ